MSLIKETFVFRSVTYQLRYIPCRKVNCSKCPHGPYWYAYVSVSGKKPAVRYIGKELTGPAAEYRTNEKAMRVNE